METKPVHSRSIAQATQPLHELGMAHAGLDLLAKEAMRNKHRLHR